MNNASNYVSANAVQRRDASEFLHEFVSKMTFSPGDVVLDIGCGPGDVTNDLLLPKLPRDIGHLVGVDIASNMVDYARENYAQPNLSFTLLDIQDPELNFELLKREIKYSSTVFEGMFDKMFSFYCLHWATNLRIAMRNMYAMMKPGGEALILFLSYHPFADVLQSVAKKERWKPYMTDIKRYTIVYQHSANPLQDLTALLVDVGFQVISCQVRKKKNLYQDKTEMEAGYKAINPFLHRIPENEQEAYLFDCNEWIRSHPMDNNGMCTVVYSTIMAHMKK